jgi:hypothetical protein
MGSFDVLLNDERTLLDAFVEESMDCSSRLTKHYRNIRPESDTLREILLFSALDMICSTESTISAARTCDATGTATGRDERRVIIRTAPEHLDHQ